MCVCVCVCACVRACVRACVCVCVIEIEFGLVKDVCSSKGVPYVSVFIICQCYVLDLLMLSVIKDGNLYSPIP